MDLAVCIDGRFAPVAKFYGAAALARALAAEHQQELQEEALLEEQAVKEFDDCLED